MIKTQTKTKPKQKRLELARETLVALSTRTLEQVHGGVVTVIGARCEPSGIIACQ